MSKHKIIIPIQGMHCASCVLNIEHQLKKIPGVTKAAVNLATEKAAIESENEIPIDQIKKAVKAAGGYSVIEAPANHGANHAQGHHQAQGTMSGGEHDHAAMLKAEEIALLKKKTIFGIVISLIAFPSMINEITPILSFIPEPVLFGILMILATPVQIWLGWQFYQGAWAGLKYLKANMDTLIAVGTTAAYGYSVIATLFPQFFTNAGLEVKVYFEAAIIILTLIVLGKYLEATAKGRASDAIKKLAGLAAKTAHLVKNGDVVDIAIDQVQVNDILLVRPGEKIPVDALIIDGESAIDESMISGESIPVDKKINDEVIGATINKSGLIKIKAIKSGIVKAE